MLEQSKADPADIAGLSLSGQMHGLVLTDDNGRALGRSIIWCDNRTIESCDEFTRLVGGRRELIRISANPALTGFTAGKVLWTREHLPEVWAKARRIQLPKDYFPDDDPDNMPRLLWRAHANALYANWINYYCYQLTPYSLGTRVYTYEHLH